MERKIKPTRYLVAPFIVSKRNYLILTFTLIYLIAFTLNGVVAGNIEFLYYTFLLGFIIYLIIYLHQRLHLGFFILFNLSILGFLHLLGGNYFVGATRLYDWYFIPYVFKYDNFIHSFGTFIGTLTLYSLLINYIGEPIKKHFPAFALALVLMALGMGSLVEIAELGAVFLFGVTERVGGYYNNALDLLFNFFGAIFASILIYYYQYRPKFIAKIDGQD